MIKLINICISLSFLLLFVNCNKEEVAPSFSVNTTVIVNDLEYWPQNQQVMFGLFSNDAKQPEYYQEIIKTGSSDVFVEISNVKSGSYIPKIYIAENTIFKASLVNFGKIEIESDYTISDKAFTFNTFSRVQEQLFNSCLQCHGGSTDIAADLNFYEGNSYQLLVNVPSKNSSKVRVKPFDVENSFIVQVLNKDNLSFDHSASRVATQGDIDLVKAWIEKGALND